MFKNMILYHLYLLICISVQIILIKSEACFDSRLRPGTCTPLAGCPDIIQEYHDQTRMSPHVIDFQSFISNSICGFDGENYMICCSSRSLDKVMMPDSEMNSQDMSRIATGPRRESTLIFASLEPATSLNNPNEASSSPFNTKTHTIKFSPLDPVQKIPPPPQQPSTSQEDNEDTNCGTNHIFINRVVGGSEAKKGTYPWMAALGYRNKKNPNILEFKCGGSLITSKHILTGAHCITDNLAVVRLGAHDLSNKAEPNARNYRIKRIILHDEYDKRIITNDLAVIELSERVVMTRFINTICLPKDPKFLKEDFVDMNPFIAGWGAQRNDGPASNTLNDAQVPIISLDTCAESYDRIIDFSRHGNKVICAGSSLTDTCQGDSGAPLMLPQLKGSRHRYYIIGVVSYGYKCAYNEFPGIYTKVAAFMPWIKKAIS